MCNNSNLYLALKEVIVDPASQDMSEVIELDHQFSRRYRRTISRIMGKAESMSHRSVKMNFKIAVSLVAAVIAISAVGVSGDNQQRNWNIAKTERIDYRHGAVDIKFFNGETTLENLKEVAVPPNMYFPKYIPDGLELDEDVTVEESDYFYFVDGEKTLTYCESGVTGNYSIDTETLVREKITVHGYEADLFYDADEPFTLILWCEGSKVFDVTGRGLSKEEVIKVARSVKRRN